MTAAEDRLPAGLWKVCAVIMPGPLMAQMDTTVVNVSLSAIQRDLHATIAAAQWIIGGYLLALALTLPLNVWLVDRVGARRLYLACFTAFTLASALCGSATSLPMLVAARVLQGAAGGLLAPMAQRMVARIAGKHMTRLAGPSPGPASFTTAFGVLVVLQALVFAATLCLPIRFSLPGADARPATAKVSS